MGQCRQGWRRAKDHVAGKQHGGAVGRRVTPDRCVQPRPAFNPDGGNTKGRRGPFLKIDRGNGRRFGKGDSFAHALAWRGSGGRDCDRCPGRQISARHGIGGPVLRGIIRLDHRHGRRRGGHRGRRAGGRRGGRGFCLLRQRGRWGWLACGGHHLDRKLGDGLNRFINGTDCGGGRRGALKGGAVIQAECNVVIAIAGGVVLNGGKQIHRSRLRCCRFIARRRRGILLCCRWNRQKRDQTNNRASARETQAGAQITWEVFHPE